MKGFLTSLRSRITTLHFQVQDIETFIDPKTNRLVCYAIGFGSLVNDKFNFKYFYQADYSHASLYYKDIFDYIFSSRKYHTFYANNFCKFDSKFIIDGLMQLDYFNDQVLLPLYNKSQDLISLTVIYKGIKYIFYDSYLLLPFSLDKQAKSINSKSKLSFPNLFANYKNLNYMGPAPGIEYYYDKNSIPLTGWFDFRATLSSYLQHDCHLLLLVLNRYNTIFTDRFKISIFGVPTLASLAKKLYRTHYFNVPIDPVENKKQYEIPIGYRHYNQDIVQAYYGGHVDVYIPKLNKGYYYDINSQYPSSKLKDMPVGIPKLVSTFKEFSKFFGFGSYNIIAPQNLKIPFLPYREKIDGANTLLFPVGQWTGWYFSEEIRYARKLGYKCTFNYGYLFIRGKDQFKDYINDLYYIKSHPANDVEKMIAKLLLNSLYGRWGITDTFFECVITSDIEHINLIRSKYIIEPISEDFLTSDIVKLIYEFRPNTSQRTTNLKEYNKLLLVYKDSIRSRIYNYPIAAAITAYSRITIDPFKIILNNRCFYTDTDSVILEHPLPISLLGFGLGSMRNEYLIGSNLAEDHKYFFVKALFIAPKIYCFFINGKFVYRFRGVSVDANLTYQDFSDFYYNIAYNYSTIIKKRGFSFISSYEYKFIISGYSNKRIRVFYFTTN